MFICTGSDAWRVFSEMARRLRSNVTHSADGSYTLHTLLHNHQSEDIIFHIWNIIIVKWAPVLSIHRLQTNLVFCTLFVADVALWTHKICNKKCVETVNFEYVIPTNIIEFRVTFCAQHWTMCVLSFLVQGLLYGRFVHLIFFALIGANNNFANRRLHVIYSQVSQTVAVSMTSDSPLRSHLVVIHSNAQRWINWIHGFAVADMQRLPLSNQLIRTAQTLLFLLYSRATHTSRRIQSTQKWPWYAGSRHSRTLHTLNLKKTRILINWIRMARLCACMCGVWGTWRAKRMLDDSFVVNTINTRAWYVACLLIASMCEWVCHWVELLSLPLARMPVAGVSLACTNRQLKSVMRTIKARRLARWESLGSWVWHNHFKPKQKQFVEMCEHLQNKK